MAQFHILSRDYRDSRFAHLENRVPGTAVPPAVCLKCGEDLAPSPIGEDAVYSIDGSKPGDLLSDGISIAVSTRFAEAYRQSELTGLEIRESPLRLSDSTARFFLAIPKATCAKLDESASGVVVHQVRGCSFCRIISIDKIDRAVIDVNSWSGEDIFCCGNLFSEIIASQRFVDFIARNRFSNFKFVRAEELCFDYRA
jgi:hypothetical protein